jgi:hypothetical protein
MRTTEPAALTVDEREERLPRWAQDKLAALRRVTRATLDELQHDRLASNPAESDMVLRPHDDVPLGLGTGFDARVRAILDHDEPDQWITLSVHPDRDGTYLELMGSATLQLTMQSSNVVKVRVRG